MNDRRTSSRSQNQQQRVGKGWHEYQCTICSHAQRDEIDEAFVNWGKPSRLAKKYSVSRDSIYRHAHALGLIDKRRRGY